MVYLIERGDLMLLKIVEKKKNSFIAKTLGDKFIKVSDFDLSNDIEIGQSIELNLNGLNYCEL